MREGSPSQHRAPAPRFAARARDWLRGHPRVLVPVVGVTALAILTAGISLMPSPTGNDHSPLPGFPSTSVRPVDAAGRPAAGPVRVTRATTRPARGHAGGATPDPAAGALVAPGAVAPDTRPAAAGTTAAGRRSAPGGSTAQAPLPPSTVATTPTSTPPPPPPPPSPSPTKTCLVPSPLQPGICLVQGT